MVIIRKFNLSLGLILRKSNTKKSVSNNYTGMVT